MEKLVSWNVNGLRACVSKGNFYDFVRRENPDVLCLQETKLQAGQIELDLPEYHSYWNYAEKKGYSGTAVLTKKEPLRVMYGLGIPEHDHEGRVITLEYPDYYLITVYVPNAKEHLERLSYRMTWEDAFLAYVKSLERVKPVIYCGDLSYRFHARENNAGWRIDYFIASEALAPRLQDAVIYTDVFGSDHCPVGLILK